MIQPKILGLRFAKKFALVTTAIIFFSNLLVFMISYSSFYKNTNSIIDSRFVVIAEDLLDTISNGLDLGLSLKELQTTQAVIESTKKSDPLVQSINVFSLETGNSARILYTTSHAGIEGTVPTEWIKEAKKNLNNKYWSIDEDDVGTIGVTILNNFQDPIGCIVIRYDQSQVSKKASVFAETIVQNILLTLLTCCTIFFFATKIALSFTLKSFNKMTEALNKLLDNEFIPSFEAKNKFEKEFIEMLQSTQLAWIEIKGAKKVLREDGYQDDTYQPI